MHRSPACGLLEVPACNIFRCTERYRHMPDSAAGQQYCCDEWKQMSNDLCKSVGIVYEILKMLQSQWRSKSGSVERFK